MRSYPPSWTTTLARLGFKRRRKTTSQERRRVRLETLEKRQMLSVSSPSSELLGDFNGDGSLDRLGGTVGGQTWLQTATGQEVWRAHQSASPPNGTGLTPEQRIVGDFDGDGRDDWLGRRNDRPYWSLYVSRADRGDDANLSWKGGFYERAVYLGDDQLGWDDPIVGDFNGDGRDDIAALVAGGTQLAVGLSTGDGFETARTFKDFGAVKFIADVAVGDFDGDGRDDLWLEEDAVGANQVWRRLLLSDGTSFVDRSSLVEQNAVHTLVADFDGDGVDEVARQFSENSPGYNWKITDYDTVGDVVVSEQDWGRGMTASSGGNWTLTAGDVNGDGRADLIGKSDTSDWRVSLAQPGRAFLDVGSGGAYSGWWDVVSGTNAAPDPDGPYRELIDIFESVYNTVELELYPGLMKGPQATAETLAGNPWDQAALLVERYEAAGYQADIAYVYAGAPWRKVRNWIGLDVDSPAITQNSTLNVLKGAFDKNAHTNGDELRWLHAMVTVTLPGPTGMVAHYVDPSWKFKDRQEGMLPNLTGYTDYPSGQTDDNGVFYPFDAQGIDRDRNLRGNFDEFGYLRHSERDQLPLDWYSEQLQGYLAGLPNPVSVADLSHDGPIRQKQFDVLPGVPKSIPIEVHDGIIVRAQGTGASFDNAAAVPEWYRHDVTVLVESVRPEVTTVPTGSVSYSTNGTNDFDLDENGFNLRQTETFGSFLGASTQLDIDSDPVETGSQPLAWRSSAKLVFDYSITTPGSWHSISFTYENGGVTETRDFVLHTASNSNGSSFPIQSQYKTTLADGYTRVELPLSELAGSADSIGIQRIHFTLRGDGTRVAEHDIRSFRFVEPGRADTTVFSKRLKVWEHALSSLHVGFSDAGTEGPYTRYAGFLKAGDTQLAAGQGAGDFLSRDTARVTLTHHQPTAFTAATFAPREFSRKPGEVIVIGLDANQYSTTHLTRLAADLNDALKDGSDAGDIPEFLAYTNAVYWKRFNESAKTIDGLYRGIGAEQWVGSGIVASDGVVYEDVDAENYEHLQFPILPVGLGVDLPNLNHVVYSAETGALSSDAIQLIGWQGSALEHAVIEEVANTESISTMRGLWDAADVEDPASPVNDQVWIIDSLPVSGNPNERQIILRGYVGDIKRTSVNSGHDYSFRANGHVYPADKVSETSRRAFLRDYILRYQVPSGTNINNPVANAIMATLEGAPADQVVRVYVPRHKSGVGDWEGSIWLAEKYESVGLVGSSYLIKQFGSETTSGGFGGGSNVIGYLPPQLPPTTFTNQTWAGDPVSVANGNLFHDEVDLSFPSPGLPLDFTRHYDAQSDHDVGLGVGWVHSFTGLLYLDNRDADGQPLDNSSSAAHDRIVWLRGDGSRHVFEWNSAAGVYDVPSSLKGHVTHSRDSSGRLNGFFHYFDTDGTVYGFKPVNADTPEFGERLVGRLRHVTSKTDQQLLIDYSTTDLARVVKIENTSSYDHSLELAYASGAVTASKRVDGKVVDTFRYTIATGYGRGDDSGRRLRYADPKPDTSSLSGYHTTYEYYTVGQSGLQAGDPRLGLMRQINFAGAGEKREYEYYANRRVFRVQMLGNTASEADAEQVFSYDLFRNVTRFTNEVGSTETYHHRDDGLLSKQVHPDGSFVRYVWGEEDDPVNEGLMLESIDELGASDVFEYFGPYDSVATRRRYGELQRHTAKDGVVTEYTYFVSPSTSYRTISAVATQTLNPGPDAEVTTYTHTDRGDVTSVQNPLGETQQTEYYAYNDSRPALRGKAKSTIDPRGVWIDGDTTPEAVTWQTLFETFEVTGDSLRVRLQSRPGYHVVADAIRIDRVRGLAADGGLHGDHAISRIVDNDDQTDPLDDDPGYEQSTTGITLTDYLPIYDGDATVLLDGAYADWTFEDLTPGVYRISATWLIHSNRDPAARYEAYDGSTASTYEVATVDQRLTPSGFNQFETSYEYNSAGLLASTIVSGQRQSMRSYNHRGAVVFEQDATGVGTTYEYDDLGRLVTTYRTPRRGASVDFANTNFSQRYVKAGSEFGPTESGRGLAMTGDNWIHAPISYTVTANTAIEFWYRSELETANHGIILDQDQTHGNSNEIYVTLHGAASGYWQEPSGYTTENGGWVHYVIPVGQLAQTRHGQVNYLKLVAASGPNGGPGHSEFFDVRLYERDPGWNLQERAVYTYHADGRVDTVTSAGYTAASWRQYDQRGRLLSTVAPDGTYTSVELDALGNTVASTDRLGATTHFAYDERDRLVQTIDPAGATVRQEFDGAGRVVKSFDPFDHPTETRYDKAGRLLSTTTAARYGAEAAVDVVSQQTYDPATGRLATSQNANGYTTHYQYDAAGRLRQTLLFDTGSQLFAYEDLTRDRAGNVTLVETVDISGASDLSTPTTSEIRPALTHYDPLGRVVEVVSPDGASTRREYDAAGRVIRSFDELGRIEESVYNSLGRLERVVVPKPTATAVAPYTRFEYDTAGRIVNEVQYVGSSVAYAGDTATVSRVYDQAGRVRQRRVQDAAAPGGWANSSMFYDASGRLVADVDALDSSAYTRYDARGLAIESRRSDPDGDGPGDAPVSTFTYDAAGRLTESTTPSGLHTATLYDTLGRVRIEVDTYDLYAPSQSPVPTNAIRQFAYDAGGRLTKQTDELWRETSFEYDALDRLVKTTSPDPDGSGPLPAPVTETVYDSFGAVQEVRERRGGLTRVTQYDYDRRNRLKEERVVGGAYDPTSPDANGLASSDGDLVTTYSYDAAGALVRTVEPNGAQQSDTLTTVFEYDDLGRLVRETLGAGEGRPQDTTTFSSVQAPTDGTAPANYQLLSGGAALQVSHSAYAQTYAQILNQVVRHNTVLELVVDYSSDLDLLAVWLDNDLAYGADDFVATQTVVADGAVTDEVILVERLAENSVRLLVRVGADRPGIAAGFSANRLGLTVGGGTATISDVRIYQTDAIITETTYDPRGAVLTETVASDPRGVVDVYTYDRRGRLYSEEFDAAESPGAHTSYEYDAAGNLTREWRRAGAEDIFLLGWQFTTYRYDRLHRQTLTIEPNPTTGGSPAAGWSPADGVHPYTELTYDAAGRVTARSNAEETRQTVYDQLGRAVIELDGNSDATWFEYNPTGTLKSVTDAEGNDTHFTYDSLDRLTAETNTLGHTRTTAYDVWGNVQSVANRENQVRTFTYDRLDRPVTETWSGEATPRLTWRYDNAGRVVYQSDGDEAQEFQYDGLGRLDVQTDYDLQNGSDGVYQLYSYTYEADGSDFRDLTTRYQFTYSNGLYNALADTVMEYDRRGRLSGLTDKEGISSNDVVVARKELGFTYNADGSLREVIREGRFDQPPSVRLPSHYQYDGAGRLKQIDHHPDTPSTRAGDYTVDDPIRGYAYTYDEASRITAIDSAHGGVASGQRGFQYDNEGQITNDDGRSIAYDDNGNRTAVDGQAVTIDPANRVQSDAEYFYSYDREGRRTEKLHRTTGELTTYEWDHRGRLIAAESRDATGGQTLDFNATPVTIVTPGGVAEPTPDGRGVRLAGDSYFEWDFPYTPTPNTVLEFRFSSPFRGDLHGLVLSKYENGSPVASEKIRVFGLEYDYTWNEYATHVNPPNQGSTGGLITYRVPIGALGQFTLDRIDKLRLLNDDDIHPIIGEGYFQDVRLYEEPTPLVTTRTEYAYNPDDQVVAKHTTDTTGRDERERRVYDGDQLSMIFSHDYGVAGTGTPEFDESLKHRYLHGPAGDQVLLDEAFAWDEANGLAVSDEVLWQLADHQNSVRDVLDESGVLRRTTEYDAFGQVTEALLYDAAGAAISDPRPIDFDRFDESTAPAGAVGQTVFYSGRTYDRTSETFNFRARRYDPDLGRFVTEDPAGFSAADANLYRYVTNSAVNYVDPSGLVQAGNPLDALYGGFGGGLGSIERSKFNNFPNIGTIGTPVGISNLGAGFLGGVGHSPLVVPTSPAQQAFAFNSLVGLNDVHNTLFNQAPAPSKEARQFAARANDLVNLKDAGLSQYKLASLGNASHARIQSYISTFEKQTNFLSRARALDNLREAIAVELGEQSLGFVSLHHNPQGYVDPWSAAYSGLGTGGKAVGNAFASTATLGFYDGPFGVTQQDIDNGYYASRFIAGVSTELLVGAATGGLSQSTKFARAGKAALGFDAATNVVGAGRGVYDISQQGLTLGNATQVAGSLVGLGANVATGGRALQEIGGDVAAWHQTLRAVNPTYRSGSVRFRVTPDNAIPLPGQALAVASYSSNATANRILSLSGRTDDLVPHHVVQDAVSTVSRRKGITINIPRSIHSQTRSFSRNADLGSNVLNLAADVRELRKALTGFGYARSLVNQQLKDLIRQNRAIGNI